MIQAYYRDYEGEIGIYCRYIEINPTGRYKIVTIDGEETIYVEHEAHMIFWWKERQWISEDEIYYTDRSIEYFDCQGK